jgi:hypothetical protein
VEEMKRWKRVKNSMVMKLNMQVAY